MDLQKEREAFEKHIQTVAHPHRSPKVMFFTVNDGHGNIIYADSVIQDQWTTWQAAIKHVVPDGFVVVPKEPTSEMLYRGYAAPDNLSAKYKAMIEAQEQANDS